VNYCFHEYDQKEERLGLPLNDGKISRSGSVSVPQGHIGRCKITKKIANRQRGGKFYHSGSRAEAAQPTAAKALKHPFELYFAG
jgi:hypothetical protein